MINFYLVCDFIPNDYLVQLARLSRKAKERVKRILNFRKADLPKEVAKIIGINVFEDSDDANLDEGGEFDRIKAINLIFEPENQLSVRECLEYSTDEDYPNVRVKTAKRVNLSGFEGKINTIIEPKNTKCLFLEASSCDNLEIFSNITELFLREAKIKAEVVFNKLIFLDSLRESDFTQISAVNLQKIYISQPIIDQKTINYLQKLPKLRNLSLCGKMEFTKFDFNLRILNYPQFNYEYKSKTLRSGSFQGSVKAPNLTELRIDYSTVDAIPVGVSKLYINKSDFDCLQIPSTVENLTILSAKSAKSLFLTRFDSKTPKTA